MDELETQSGTKQTVLVVDDAQTVLHLVDGVLTAAGYEVVCVPRSSEALLRARQVKPQLVLLDYSVGEMSAYQVCRGLGEDAALNAVPIVVMKARGVGRFVRELGIVDHISKPFAPEALVAVVQHTLAKHQPNGSFRSRELAERSVFALRRDGAQGVASLAQRIAETVHDTAQGQRELAERVQTVLESADAIHDMRDVLGKGQRPTLAGDLASVAVAEVLQLLSLQRQTGFLTICHEQQSVSVAFDKGKVCQVTGEGTAEEFMLGRILVRERIVEERELEVLLLNRKGSRRRLGSQVVKLGYVTLEQLQGAMRLQSCELVYEVLRWDDGYFTFYPQVRLPADVLEFEFGLGIDMLLMEGYRRVDEWGLIETVLPSLDVVLRPRPGGSSRVELTDEENALLKEVDGERTATEVIGIVGSGTFQGARLLYRLLSAHVIEHEQPSLGG